MPRPNQVWYRQDIGWWMVTLNGKKERLIDGPKTKEFKELAEEKFVELRKLSKIHPLSPNARVADIIDTFLEWAEKELSLENQRNLNFYGQKFAECWGYIPVSTLTPFHVTKWVQEHPWGETTRYNAKKSLFRIFSWAKSEGILATNPLAGLSRPKPPPRERALTDPEYKLLIKHSRIELRQLLFALRNTGARPKELRCLTWDQFKGDHFFLREHKTSKKTHKPRIIYLTAVMQRFLVYLQRKAKAHHVFVNSRGKPWPMNAVRLSIARLKKKLGLKQDVCAYLIRHQFGTAAVLNGINPSVVAELMGNSLEMVSKVYVNLADQGHHLVHAMEKANRPVAMPSPTARR